MIIKIITPDKKEYLLSEGLYAIDGVWLFEDNELTGRLNIALLKDCKLEIDLEHYLLIEVMHKSEYKTLKIKKMNN